MGAPFYMDIGRGQRFTCTASYVAVTAQMLAPPLIVGLTGPYVSGSLTVYAGIGHGTSPTLASIIDTQYIDTFPVFKNHTANVIVPPMANLLLPVQSNDIGATFTMDFLDNNGQNIGQLVVGAGQLITPIPLTNECYSINVSSSNVVTQSGLFTNMRLPFQLSV